MLHTRRELSFFNIGNAPPAVISTEIVGTVIKTEDYQKT